MKVKVCKGRVVEVEKVDNKITLGLRLRVPEIHNSGIFSQIKDEDLPIAYPITIPILESSIDSDYFESSLLDKVIYVIYFDGQYHKPYYLGLEYKL